MTIRLFEHDDLPKVVETYTSAIRVLAVPNYAPEQIVAWAPVPPDLDRWGERLAQLKTVVADKDGSIAGFAAYTPKGYLDFLFTHPSFARCGVASQLYRTVETDLIDQGVSKITAHVSLAARDFFDHHGFQIDLEEEVECRGVLLRRFGMHKVLPSKT